MGLNNILSFLVPKNDKFFSLFAEDTANLVEQARCFHQLFSATHPEEVQRIIDKVKDFEHKGDEITHRIFLELSANFITPIDREDIHYLASSIDDIADYINGSASRIHLYNVTEFTEPMRKLSEIIIYQAEEIHAAISNLKGAKNHTIIKEHIVKINALENQADDIFDNAIAALFIEEADTMRLIKMKEVLNALETATDKCEDVSHVLESILVKTS
jgi:predicted phosphate transport protein (TIGR00153 family)